MIRQSIYTGLDWSHDGRNIKRAAERQTKPVQVIVLNICQVYIITTTVRVIG